MPTYERSVHVDAPLEAVWDFHSRVSGLERVTPGWLDLRVEAVRTPDGDVVANRDPDSTTEDLRAGSAITVSVAPGGVGPRQRWTSRIVSREQTEDSASIRDVMVDGPFPEWDHTHRFHRAGEGTRVEDVVRYELPGGRVARSLGPLAWLGFEPVFASRHRRTKELLEGHDSTTGTGHEGGDAVAHTDV